ncbi:hypothetical protein [Pseudomonas aeruginosa]|uniref:hypothetical protein n=1 Tax=Pseudomonas aeruginosa TaxID=287 RepID=UPI0009D3DACA|nr:hypothetical protein [Pseudomonas aeruginosa]OOH26419.1 hypothetical protein B0B32_05700 [Pseudomonas aeruginosa]OOH43595.1 hypothetical protein B0B31_11750 [Pseudomonas aeruginosa]
MNKANECTCPSGDGSLRWPCPAHPAVEQAVGDERAAFEAAFAAMGRPVCRADYDQDAYGTPFDDGGWTGWQARAALAQPSPALPPFAEKVLAKLRRFYDCASDFESGGVDIGRHWLDLLTQLGLLNRVQRSPALWEISQQGEDLLGMPQPSPAQAEAERPEVVAYRTIGRHEKHQHPHYALNYYKQNAEDQAAHWRERGCEVSEDELMTVAQHDRIFGALRADRDSWAEQAEQRLADWDEMRKERDAALARVAELEKLSRAHDPLRIGLSAMLGSFKTATNPEQEGTLRMARQLLDATADARYGDFKNKAIVDRLIAGLRTPVAQAQHSVPETTNEEANSFLRVADAGQFKDNAAAVRTAAMIIRGLLHRPAIMKSIIRHRIGLTPEYEGQWHADLYGEDGEVKHHAEADTPDEAVRAVVALAAAPGKEGV